MSKYNKEKFYWLKLKRDFFKRHDIQIVESMPNGKDYILFYLKLLCESVDHNGSLRFNDEIPYNEEMLSTITNTNIDIVRSAIKVFATLKMIDIYDDGTYYMKEVEKMIGYQSISAEKKQIQRANKCKGGQMSDLCPPDIDIDIDKELDIEIEEKKYKRKEIEKKDNSIEEIFDFWNSKKIIVHRELIPELTAIIKNAINNYGKDNILSAIDRYSIVLKAEKFKLISYKWALKDFLKRKNALPDFLDDGSKWIAYNEWLAKENNYCNKVIIQDSGTKFGIDQNYLDSLG